MEFRKRSTFEAKDLLSPIQLISKVEEEWSQNNETVRKFKKFDLFQKRQEVAQQKTSIGGFFSLAVAAIICYLFVYEFIYFLKPIRKDTLSVDMETKGRIAIFFNISFPHVNCNDLHVDSVDQTGESQIDVHHHIYKTPIDNSGNLIETKLKHSFVFANFYFIILTKNENVETGSALLKEKYDPVKDPYSPMYCGSCYKAGSFLSTKCCNSCQSVLYAYQKANLEKPNLNEIEQCMFEVASQHPGCNMDGVLEVQKIAGNFHFAPGRSFVHEQDVSVHHVHEFNPLLINRFNISHIVHSLSFGERNIPYVKYPLDNTDTMVASGLGLQKYFIKIVPTTYHNGWFSTRKSFQYSYTKHLQHFQDVLYLPGIFFIYDLSPIQITYTEDSEPFLHFIVRLCAIIGGVFATTGLVGRFSEATLKRVAQKEK